MTTFHVGDQVRIADINDPPFPSMIGRVGYIQMIHAPIDADPRELYDVKIGTQIYACYPDEIVASSTQEISPNAPDQGA